VAEKGNAPPIDPGLIETEFKLSASDARPLQRLADMPRLGGLRLGNAETFLELDRYLDTADGRLAAARWACRLRYRSRKYLVSLKGPDAGATGMLEGALHRRPEVEGPANASLDPDDWPDSPARSHLLGFTGSEPLEERFLLRQLRTQRPVLKGRRHVGTLSLDRVRVVQRGEPLGTLWCVELELRAASAVPDDKAMGALLSDLMAVGGLEIEPLTKLERARALMDHVSA
jgi:inorganic triphosphatase YgiF